MDREFLSVESKTPIETVSSLALERSNEKLYDFIVVTQNNKYFGSVAVKDLLQELLRIQVITAKQQNPLTGLPGNLLIEQKLQEYVCSTNEFTVSYIDIDNFKPYNDIYGFENGDLIIKLLSDILQKYIPEDQFIGHIGGDDFIVILDGHKTAAYFSNIIEKFESEIKAFYSQTDRRNGYMTGTSRHGIVEKIPLITLTVVFVTNELRNFENTLEISSMLSGLKTNAKRLKAI